MTPHALSEERQNVDHEWTTTRRGALVAGAGLVAAALGAKAASGLPVLRQSPPSSGAWPFPAHDLEASRHAGSANLRRERWRQSLAGGIPGAAAIAQGRVYAASLGGAAAAYELGDGREIWTRDLGTAVYGSGQDARELGFFGGVALAGRSLLFASDRVFCLDAVTGSTRWESTPLRNSGEDDYFWGPPVVFGDLVFVGSGSGGELPDTRGRLSAYRIADGRLAWSTPTVPAGGNGGGVIGPCSVDPILGLAYIATGAPYQAVPGANQGTCSLIALRLRDGAVVWSDQVYPADTPASTSTAPR